MTTTENPRLDEKHQVELTSAEIYVIKAALERLSDNDDGAYLNIAEMASELWGQLPKVEVTFNDLSSE